MPYGQKKNAKNATIIEDAFEYFSKTCLKHVFLWESHNDEVHKMPNGFRILASSDACQVQVMQHETLPYAGVQYHPEVENTEFGAEIFQNFLDKALEWNK